MSGLFLVTPKKGRKSLVKKQEPARWSGMSDMQRPQIEYMWRDEAGTVLRRIRKWDKPQTEDAIADWMQDYFDKVAEGYIPADHETPPIPFCARVTVGARIRAEWISRDELLRRSALKRCK